MTRTANAARGEAVVCGHVLRPTFAALVAAEEELGPLFALVERAAAGELRLAEMAALFWHCRHGVAPEVTREAFSDAVAQAGMAATAPVLKTLLGQILAGR
jgi:hypothetical protein